MSPSRAVNLSLTLVVAGWLLAVYRVLSQLGDPAPNIPASVIEKERQSSVMMSGIGIILLLISVWLWGYSFVQAKWRASIAMAACLLPAVALLISIVS
jgi:hypothetical protein